MTLHTLQELVYAAIHNIKEHGTFPTENGLYDYKKQLHVKSQDPPHESFLKNFAKDIVAFGNNDGGIMLIGVEQDQSTGVCTDVGLSTDQMSLIRSIDLNDVTQRLRKVLKAGVNIDLQPFQIGSRHFYYLLIEKQSQILIPAADYPDYKLQKGEVIYRGSGKNELANESTTDFNRFLHKKAEEKHADFMKIWSQLLPEVFQINPKDVIILDPGANKVYAFNSSTNSLSSSELEIEA